ncbi:MAG: ABC transporter ATP-binding protein [Marinobacter sp.]
MAEIKLKTLAHSYSKKPSGPEDYAIRKMEHVWAQGGAYALLGPSGCGKSTLLNIISGLVTPSEGDVLFDGKRMNELPPEKRNIAQVFQFPVIYDTMTVFENLAFPLRNQGGFSQEQIREKVHEVADVLELSSELKRKAKNLSADQKQKVSMGRGLVREDVTAILFDEPLTVIDPQLKWRLRRKLKQIHERFDITMVYVTHDQLEASTFADKIALMYEGQIVQFGTPQELFERPAHTFVGYFIGSPGMNFFEPRLTDDGLIFNGKHIPVSESVLEKVRRSGSDNIKLGIRPEFVTLGRDTGEQQYDVTVTDIEDLGTYRMVDVEFGPVTVKIRIPEDQTVPREAASIGFPDPWLKVYVDERLVEADHE